MRAHIADLCEAPGKLGAWVRLHYVYPTREIEDLLPLMQDRAILPYLDIPFQHASPSVLKTMRRPGGHDRLLVITSYSIHYTKLYDVRRGLTQNPHNTLTAVCGCGGI